MVASNLIRRTFHVVVPILALVLFVGLAYKITQTQPAASRGKSGPSPKLVVEAMPVKAQMSAVTIESYGVVNAKTNSELYSLVSGQIMSVARGFESGAVFSEGDILLEVDSADYEVALQVAKSNLVSAELAVAEEEARFEQAERDWKTQRQRTGAKKTDKVSDYALRLPQLRAAKANLDTASAQLTLAELNLARTKIRAPYDGRILEIFVDRGSVVSPTTQLARMYATDAIEIRLPIASKDLKFIDLPELNANADSSDQANSYPMVQLENKLTEPAEVWTGQIVRAEAAIDAKSQQLYVVARVDNPFDTPNRRALKIGQYVSAFIRGRALDRIISIPNSAIYQGAYVYVLESDSEPNAQGVIERRLQRKDIKVLWRNQELSLIESGLSDGQRVVTTLLGQITSGTLVEERINANNVSGDSP